MTADPDLRALLATIAANPDEDTPRLILADRFDELGEHDRVEFIRVQCEARCHHGTLAKPCGVPACVHPGCALLKRADELLAAHEAEWRRAGPCGTCGGTGKTFKKGRTLNIVGKVDGYPVKRTESVQAINCPDCGGTGDRGGLMGEVGTVGPNGERPWQHLVTFHRGFPRVHCRAADVWGRVPRDPRLDLDERMNYAPAPPEYRPTHWALAVCAAHPDVEALWADDYAIVHDGTSGWDRRLTPPGVIDAAVSMGLTWEMPEQQRRLVVSRAVVRWCRAVAAVGRGG